MIQVAIVYGDSEETLAGEIADYLETNCRVMVDRSLRVTPEFDVLEASGRALGADAAILFLSPRSVPRRLERREWEPLFLEAAGNHHTHVSFVKVADCPFPQVLLRSRCYSLTPDVVACARGLRRWLIELQPPAQPIFAVPAGVATPCEGEVLEMLRRAIVDRPGRAEITTPERARWFAEAVRADFEGILWVDCRGASWAGIAGETGTQLGLRLPGELDCNVEIIKDILAAHRCLIVMLGDCETATEQFAGPGRTSLLRVTEPQPQEELSIDAARSHLRSLSSWMTDPASVPASGTIRRTLDWLLFKPEDWITACDFSRAALAFFRFQDRLAEGYEVADLMLSASVARQDGVAADEFGRERAWILESWGRRPDSIHPFNLPPAPAEQLYLF